MCHIICAAEVIAEPHDLHQGSEQLLLRITITSHVQRYNFPGLKPQPPGALAGVEGSTLTVAHVKFPTFRPQRLLQNTVGHMLLRSTR